MIGGKFSFDDALACSKIFFLSINHVITITKTNSEIVIPYIPKRESIKSKNCMSNT